MSITVEKKRHTLKNTVMAQPDKFIVFLGRTLSGHHHDDLMLKQEFPPELDWLADINVRVDRGSLGIRSDYRGDRIDIPTTKPRKSQKHPNPQLSDEQKAANTALSRVRIFIEHAIGGMKRYNIGFWGTTEQETGVSAACWVANVLLSARNRRIWRNGHGFLCKSPLQKPKLVRQLLQSQIANLLNCMHLCLNRVFCSVVP